MDMTTHELNAELLRFGFGETRLGTVLIALSRRRVAAILLGDDRRKLQRELGDAEADVQLIENEFCLTEAIEKVTTLVDAPHRDGHALTETWPALIAAVTDRNARITGVHRT